MILTLSFIQIIKTNSKDDIINKNDKNNIIYLSKSTAASSLTVVNPLMPDGKKKVTHT